MIKLEKKARQLTGEERALLSQFFGDEQFPQNRFWILGVNDLMYARERNNIDRPSGYGFLIHDLLSTCALLHSDQNSTECENERLRARLDLIREAALKLLDYDTATQPLGGYEAGAKRLRDLVNESDDPNDFVDWRKRALTAEKERDEARALKVPPTTEALCLAQMEAATLQTELDALKLAAKTVVESFEGDGFECIDRLAKAVRTR